MKTSCRIFMSLILSLLIVTSTVNLISIPIQLVQSQIPQSSTNTTIMNNTTGGSNNLTVPNLVGTLNIGGNGTILPSTKTMVAETSSPPSLSAEQAKEINQTIADTRLYPKSLTQTANPSLIQENPDPNSATLAGPQPTPLTINDTKIQTFTNTLNNLSMSNKTLGNSTNIKNDVSSSNINKTNILALQHLTPLNLYTSQVVQPVPSSNKHVLAEPSVAQNGSIVFYTGNVFAARSDNFGTSWKYIDPFAGFPGPSPFCCDQIAVFDHQHGIFGWFKQGRSDPNTGENTVVLGISKDASNWWFYNLKPTLFNSAWTNQWFDYPHISFSNNYLYLTTNTFDASDQFKQSVTIRFDLNDLSNQLPVHFQYFSEENQFNYTPVQGATNTMYIATHDSAALGNKERIYQWPDNGPIRVFSIPVPAWSFGSQDMVCYAPDGTNWCGRSDSRITGGWISNDITTGNQMIGFLWNAKQGGAFNFPYIDVATFTIDNNNVVYKSSPIIWHPNIAWQYGVISPKSDGSLGLVAFYGGGSFYPSIAAGIVDSSTGNPPPYQLITVKSSNSASSLWGDYITDRTYNGVGPIWLGAAWTLQGCNSNACVEPLFFAFGR